MSDLAERTIREWMGEYAPQLLAVAQSFATEAQEAEDLVQETMLKAMRFMDSYQDGTDVQAWLMTILRRTHIDLLRAGRKHARDVSIEGADLALATEDQADPGAGQPGHFDDQWDHPEELLGRLEDQTVVEALSALPREIRWTLLLVDVEQMAHTQAAAVLEVPVGTIKSRAHRGRRMLRDRLMGVARKRGWV